MATNRETPKDGIPRDKDIRKEFIKRNLNFFKGDNCVFVNEYGINRRNVVDLALFNFNRKLLYGFEIKSAVDNLKRLEKQLCTYTDFFNIVYVICASNHVEGVYKLLKGKSYEKFVGIIEVDNDLNFKEIKKCICKPSFFDTFIKNLDKEEIVMLCEERKISTEGSKLNLIGRLKPKVNIEELYASLKNKLRKFYIKECEVCKSRLYYNKFVKGEKNSYCYECGSIILDY